MVAVLSEIQTGMISVLGNCMPSPGCRGIEMIKTFADKQLKALWETGKSRIDTKFHNRILYGLEVLDSASSLDMLNIQGFRFHALRGYKPKRYTIHVNGPRCITFEFRDGDAYALKFEQYH